MRPTRGKRTELARWLEEHGPARIGETEFEALGRALAPVSESYLRKLVRESGVPLDPMVEGVRQGSFDELEASLLRLLEEYERGDPARRAVVRRRPAGGAESREARRKGRDDFVAGNVAGEPAAIRCLGAAAAQCGQP